MRAEIASTNGFEGNFASLQGIFVMTSRKRIRTGAFLFIILMLLNSTGIMVYYGYLLTVHKAMQSDKIASGQIALNSYHTFKLLHNRSSKDVHLVGNSEIEANGHMFDVIRKYSEGNYSIYICLADKGEDNILHQLASLFNLKAPADSRSQNDHQVTLNNPLKYLSCNLFAILPFSLHLSVFPDCSTYTYKDPLISFPSPPPERA